MKAPGKPGFFYGHCAHNSHTSTDKAQKTRTAAAKKYLRKLGRTTTKKPVSGLFWGKKYQILGKRPKRLRKLSPKNVIECICIRYGSSPLRILNDSHGHLRNRISHRTTEKRMR